ncbi:MAG: hypothetical protein H5U40_05150 [Polyangiaceae bacterium]|nr:hypothetical protein [Polyangiaceae bacterium]
MTRRILEEVDRFDILDSEQLVEQGLVGIEVRSRNPDEGLELVTRHFVGRQRTYTLLAATRADSARASQPTIDYFFRSLAVSPADAIVPNGDGRMGTAWAFTTPARDDFSVRLPGAPRVAEVELDLEGEPTPGREYQVATEDGSVRFVARVYRFDREMPSRLLEKVESRMVADGRTVRERIDRQRQGYAGAVVTYARGGSVVHTTYVQTVSRLYEFTLESPAAREAELEPARLAFFRSIRIH